MKIYSYPSSPGSVFRILLVVSIFSILVSACGQAQAASLQLSVGEDGDVLSMEAGSGLPKQEATQPENDLVEESLPAGVGGGAPQGAGQDPQASITEPTIAAPVEAPAAKEIPSGETAALDLPVGPQVGFLAPDFSLQTPDGKTINLSDLRGRPLVISYWASWCGPCENEMSILQGVYEQYQASGLTVLAVDAIEQDSISGVTEMVSRLGVTYPVVLDYGDQFADSYNALFFPTSYFVDADGVIQDIALGDSPEAEFQARVERFLASQ